MFIHSTSNRVTYNPSFSRFRAEKDSFNALKNYKYFPPASTPNYNEMLLDFYKKLKDVKSMADKNSLYDTIIKVKNEKGRKQGFVVIQDQEGVEQTGFVYSFDDLFRQKSLEKKDYKTEEQIPNAISRYYKNWMIKKYNENLDKTPINYQNMLNMILSRISSVVETADYLKSLALKSL